MVKVLQEIYHEVLKFSMSSVQDRIRKVNGKKKGATFSDSSSSNSFEILPLFNDALLVKNIEDVLYVDSAESLLEIIEEHIEKRSELRSGQCRRIQSGDQPALRR